jgi:PAS domain-containing protein
LSYSIDYFYIFVYGHISIVYAHQIAVRERKEHGPMSDTFVAADRQTMASSALRQISAEELQALLDLSPDALVLVNQEGTIVRANEQAAVLFGYPESVLCDLPLQRLLPYRFRQQHTTHQTQYFAAPRARAMGVGLPLFGLR